MIYYCILYNFITVYSIQDPFLRKSSDVQSINVCDEKLSANANASYHIEHADMLYLR